MSFSPAYAHVLNFGAQSVSNDSDITFDSTGALVGFQHEDGSSIVTNTDAGVYQVMYTISASSSHQVGIVTNGISAPRGNFGSALLTGLVSETTGQHILALAADTSISLKNYTPLPIFLPSNISGSNATNNASLTIVRIA